MLDDALRKWLDEHAEALDTGPELAAHVLPRLAAAGLYRLGVPAALGGQGGSLAEAMQGIAELARHSLTAAFVAWGQRAFIEYLVHAESESLRERSLPALLAGELAGATGLSNAIKFLSGLEGLSVTSQPTAAGYRLQGQLPWVTNLRPGGFVAACAVAQEGHAPAIFAVPHDSPGLVRSPDLPLVALRASNTAALQLSDVALPATQRLHADAPAFVRAVRPAFLGLQCGLSCGLARAALQRSRELQAPGRSVLALAIGAAEERLEAAWQELTTGVVRGAFVDAPRPLFELRIQLAELTAEALQLELQASGGKAYLTSHDAGFARRWREAAFVPIVTPSLVQLRAELQS